MVCYYLGAMYGVIYVFCASGTYVIFRLYDLMEYISVWEHKQASKPCKAQAVPLKQASKTRFIKSRAIGQSCRAGSAAACSNL